jgi:uncharacterized membrane protein
MVQHYGAYLVYIENKPGFNGVYCNCVLFIPVIPSTLYAKWYILYLYLNSFHSVLIVWHMMSMAATSYTGIKHNLLSVQQKLDIINAVDTI